MCNRDPWSLWCPLGAGLAALVIVTGPVRGQAGSSSSSAHDQSKNTDPVVRTFGGEGGYHTELTSKTEGTLNDEDRRQDSLLMAQVFQHIMEARDAVDAEDAKEAIEEVNKGLAAIKAIRSMLPRTILRTKTTAPGGKVIYEDERAVQEGRIPIYEGLLHTQTLAPVVADRRSAMEVAGLSVVDSETIVTEAIADLDPIERQLTRAAKALKENKIQDAAKALGMALIRGIEFRYSKDDSPLAAARDAIWLARRSLEENNVAQALVNLALARVRLQLYRGVLSQDQRQEVDQMLQEINQLEAQLRQETTQPATRAERARQGSTVTNWWDKINGWFRRHL
jgi:hypothetical protein